MFNVAAGVELQPILSGLEHAGTRMGAVLANDAVAPAAVADTLQAVLPDVERGEHGPGDPLAHADLARTFHGHAVRNAVDPLGSGPFRRSTKRETPAGFLRPGFLSLRDSNDGRAQRARPDEEAPRFIESAGAGAAAAAGVSEAGSAFGAELQLERAARTKAGWARSSGRGRSLSARQNQQRSMQPDV